jgi:hypothetical protein
MTTLIAALPLIVASCVSTTNASTLVGIDTQTAQLAAQASTPAAHVRVAQAYRQRAEQLDAEAQHWQQAAGMGSTTPAIVTKNPAIRAERERDQRRAYDARQLAQHLRERAQWHYNRATEIAHANPTAG